MSKKRRLICDDHDDILEAALDIEGVIAEENMSLITPQRKVLTLTRKIQKLVLRAKESGEFMERRLDDYYESISRLGFKRKKK